jgi:serine/threonine protein phosphatase PrpC
MNLQNVLDIAGRSHAGRVRARNEDRIGHAPEIGVVILADGMGGYRAGDVASRIAVESVLEQLRLSVAGLAPGEIDPASGYARESLAVRQAIASANDLIYQTAKAEPRYQGMGTTLVMAIFYDDRITVAHVGDSRMYRLRDDRLEQITVDHTLRQEMISRGFFTPDEARAAVAGNLVTRAVGTDANVAVDIREDRALANDIYLLCSDGLTDMVDDRDIHRLLKTCGGELDEAAAQLIALANQNGGRDNVSVVLARPRKAFPAGPRWRHKLASWF